MYLTPALAKVRPSGVVYAWIDAFLLPEPSTSDAKELPFTSDLPAAIAAARIDQTRKLVFVDFTGKTCQNCKYNEYNIFPRPEVDVLLRQFQLAQMYTDEVPLEFFLSTVSAEDSRKEALANEEFQKKAFGDEKLPLYAILEPLPNGRVRKVAVYDEGKINDASRFVEFLKKGLGK